MEILGVLAAIVYSIAFIRYIYSMIKSKNKPNRATWIIWSILGFILLASYYTAGARDTVPLLIINQIGMISVFLFSLKYGQGGVDKFDIFCLTGAGISLLIWYISNNPLYALLLGIMTDFIGALPTIKKSNEQSESEDKLTWGLFLVGNFLNLLASGFSSFSSYVYPLYMVLLCFLILMLLVKKNKQQNNKRKQIIKHTEIE